MSRKTSRNVLWTAAAVLLSIELVPKYFGPFMMSHAVATPGIIVARHVQLDIGLSVLLSWAVDSAFCFVLVVVLFMLSRCVYRKFRSDKLDS